MKIVILDAKTLGEDLDLSAANRFGEVLVYPNSTEEEVAERVTDTDVVIINKIKMNEKVLKNAKNLKLICVAATGFDNIDTEYCKKRGIRVANVPAYSTYSVAQVTVSMVCSLMTHLEEYHGFVKSGEYTKSKLPNRLTPVCHDISGKTWGIIGYGNIGRSVGRVAEALGAKVIVYKRNPCDDATCVDIETLCRESDIITVHCPLNKDSRELINAEKIALMKPNVILVNEARGAVLDEKVIADAVISGKISGFGCDVYSEEPFGTNHPYNSILECENVIFTPHAAWGSYESRERCIYIIAENIDAFVSGKTLNRVDK